MKTLLARNADVLVTMDRERRELKDAGLYAEDGIIDLGGGIGVPEQIGQAQIDLAALDAGVKALKHQFPGIRFWMEPGRFLVARTTKGPVIVVNLDDPSGKPVEFATTAAANRFLISQAVSAVDESDFQSFESVYQESRPKPSVWARVGSVLVAVVLCGAVAVGIRRWLIQRVSSA